MKKLSNRMLALVMCLCMIFTMMPMAAHATEVHVHYGGEATCRWKATCEECGSMYGETDPNNHNDYFGEDNGDGTHTAMCTCGHVYNAAEPHGFSDWEEDGPGQEARFCYECYYTETRSTHTHEYSAATCTTPATCSCNATQGDVDKNNHVGGTEIRNKKEATESEDGYTGDTYCLGCSDKLTDGETIPATHQHAWEWTYDSTLHWQKCDCGESSTAAEGHLYDDDTDATCNKCGYTRTIEHTHEWGKYESNGDGSHTRICTTDNSHRQKEDCGGTATCHELATCPDCGASYGEYNKNNHVGGTEIRNKKEESEFEDGYTGDTYCKGCNSLLSEGETIPATHVHSYSIQYSDIHHWDECSCGDTRNLEGHYGHGDDGSCDDCGYHVHVWRQFHNANGTHTLICTFDSSHVEIDETEYGYSWASDKTTHWKVCKYCATNDKDWDYHVYDSDSDPICNICGYRREDFTHAHRYAFATCVSPALCSCGVTSGEKNPNNHTGGTEIRNAAEATIVAEGYTGDTYCKGCGAKISSGEVIPKITQITERTDTGIVTFTPVDGLVLPEDAELVVEPHTPTEDDLDFVLFNTSTEYVDMSDENIYGSQSWSMTTPDGVIYKDEFVIIDGVKYFLADKEDGEFGLINTDDGSFYSLSFGSAGEIILNKKSGELKHYEKTKDKMLSLNGATYEVVAMANELGGSEDGFEGDRYTFWILYHNGEPAGRYYPNQGAAQFFEGFDPETVKAQQDENDLGTVTTGESPIDGLKSGKTYNVSVIGSNDISVPGAENVTGTITQTFAVPDALIGNKNVVYTAIHKTASGNEIGEITLYEYGKTVTARYEVEHLSPFTVYAFIEADEPEIKTLSATIVDGTDDTTEAPDTSEPVVSPQTSDSWIWYVLVAVVAGGIAVASVVYGKRRKSKANNL